MSDTGRQSLTDKVGSAVKPDSQKSTTEQASDFIKGNMDAAASAMQPDSEKSATQKAGDAANDMPESNSQSLVGKLKKATGLDGNA